MVSVTKDDLVYLIGVYINNYGVVEYDPLNPEKPILVIRRLVKRQLISFNSTANRPTLVRITPSGIAIIQKLSKREAVSLSIAAGESSFGQFSEKCFSYAIFLILHCLSLEDLVEFITVENNVINDIVLKKLSEVIE